MLRVAELHAGYGSTPVLCGVSLGLRAGEVLALMGRNGAGKTTLMRTIIGLLRPRSGSIELDGASICACAAPSHRAKRRRLRAAGPRHLRQADRA